MASSSSSTYYYEKAKEAMAMATSVAASVMLARSLANELLPYEARDLLNYGLDGLRSRMTWRHTMIIDQCDVQGWYGSNGLFYHVKTYLASRMEAAGTIYAQKRLRLCSGSMDDEDPEKLVVSLEEGEEMPDVYEGVEFRWCLYNHPEPQGDSITSGRSRKQYYQLTLHKDHKEKAIKEYLPFISATSNAIRNKERCLTIYMNDGSEWSDDIDLDHPFTFKVLAMEEKKKKDLIDDLDKFIKRKDYYRRIGKAWKRGYLLYGPPGTGKSSLVAAMANYLRFDIYELELTAVESNTQLRKLLLGMSNKAILLIEDIDCTIELKKRDDNKKKDKPPNESSDSSSSKDEKVTLSGLLNFVDGLWSTTGEERIIVFTTNYKERLDPALLRPGRMDKHIYMGHCTSETVRILVNNYLAIDNPVTYSKTSDGEERDEKEIEALTMAEIEALMAETQSLMAEIEELVSEVKVTPAEVAEILIRSEIPRVALLDLIEFLKSKKECANNKEEDEEKDKKECANKKEEEEEKDGDDPKEEEDGDDAKKEDADDSIDDDKDE
ncbi:unnamed protein product [Alopecurus aequalis]